VMKSHKLIQLCFPIELLLPIGAQVAKNPADMHSPIQNPISRRATVFGPAGV